MSGWGAIYDTVTAGLQRSSTTLASLQEQIATGAKILRASDNPSDASKIMSLRTQNQSLEAYSKNLAQVIANRERASGALQELSGTFISVQELLLQAANGTYTQTQRTSMAEGIDALLEQAVSGANSELMGRYLFSGNSTSTAPYVVERTGGKISAVTYQGATQNLMVTVASGVDHAATVVGDSIFRSDERQEPSFFGNTGASAGTGTSSVRGDVWLTLEHDTTTYSTVPVDTGVAAGTRSPGDGGDTILGTSHKLYINADNSTVRLDDGEFQSYIGGPDDLQLVNTAGDVVYVDMSSIAGGLSGTVEVSITASAKMSIDDMTSTVNLTSFSDNEAVTDDETKRILYVDATGITRVGVAPVRVPGTYDVFGLLISVRDLLTNERGLSQNDQMEQLSEALGSAKEVMGSVVEGLTFVGAALQAMDTLRYSLEDIQGNLESQRSAIQDTDLVEVATQLAWNQTYYEMMLATAARVLNMSLISFLR